MATIPLFLLSPQGGVEPLQLPAFTPVGGLWGKMLDWVAFRRAMRGAAEIEKQSGLKGSIGRLDPASIDVQSGMKCPLAGIYGSYDSSPAYLRAQPAYYGFHIGRLPIFGWARQSKAWRKVIHLYAGRAIATS